MCWKSKRQSVYAQGARATWTLCQWWVEMTKEDETRRAGARGLGGKKWGRSGQGLAGSSPGEGNAPGGKRFSYKF